MFFDFKYFFVCICKICKYFLFFTVNSSGSEELRICFDCFSRNMKRKKKKINDEVFGSETRSETPSLGIFVDKLENTSSLRDLDHNAFYELRENSITMFPFPYHPRRKSFFCLTRIEVSNCGNRGTPKSIRESRPPSFTSEPL